MPDGVHSTHHGTPRPRIVVFFGASGRAQPATGPLRSLIAMMTGLERRADFTFVVHEGLAKALGDAVANHVRVVGAPAGDRRRKWLRQLLRAMQPDLILLNSFFDREFTMPVLFLRRARLLSSCPIILSPRGEFAHGALSLKSSRKRLYVALTRTLGLTRGVWLHATAAHERGDIEEMELRSKGILRAPNARDLAPTPATTPSKDGPLRIAFLGRVTPVKNLDFALRVLAKVTAPTKFEIYGPIADADYWASCQCLISLIPEHVQVSHHGILDATDVVETLAGHDLFFLPTKGENFGHAINEALSAGLPALISDATPWRNLQALGAGWDLPLSDAEAFTTLIDSFARLPHERRMEHRRAARALAEKSFIESDALDANWRMFNTALNHQLEGAQ